MPKFKYKAIDTNGKEKTGTIEAVDPDEANSKLSASGLMPVKIEDASSAASGKVAATKASQSKKKGQMTFAFGKVIQAEGLTRFTRQSATLLDAGLPLLRALEVMIRQEKNVRFKAVLEEIADQLKSGNSFSDGLSQHPKIFDRLFVNMVRAGEAGSVLNLVLSRQAGFMEKSLKTKKKVKAAMVYPIAVISLAFSIVALLMVVVVPKFQVIFDDMLGGAVLPGPTQIVVNLSDFMRENVFLTLIIAVLGVVGVKFFLKTRIGADLFNWGLINTPKLGDLVSKVNIARITRTFGTLLSSGVPILEAINITKDITNNRLYERALIRIHDSVRDGEPLARPMERESAFPNMVTSMVDVGEETGELAQMLNRVADNYDEDVDNAVAGITSIIEPIMIIFLACVVGFIVIALFLPIVEIIRELTN